MMDAPFGRQVPSLLGVRPSHKPWCSKAGGISGGPAGLELRTQAARRGGEVRAGQRQSERKRTLVGRERSRGARRQIIPGISGET